eukprot:gb/GECG01007998.1/.p1 GENE.gb/GECG01007998.1/~~gb/GECG01007998.1/.p1  ORF type:complete len:468 (+),score=58.44 gb/GECG01007998.1/:1-1404(+)
MIMGQGQSSSSKGQIWDEPSDRAPIRASSRPEQGGGPSGATEEEVEEIPRGNEESDYGMERIPSPHIVEQASQSLEEDEEDEPIPTSHRAFEINDNTRRTVTWSYGPGGGDVSRSSNDYRPGHQGNNGRPPANAWNPASAIPRQYASRSKSGMCRQKLPRWMYDRDNGLVASNRGAYLYRGLDLVRGVPIAVKEMRGERKGISALEVLKEMDDFHAIQHENVVQYYGCEWDNNSDTFYMLMEYMPGKSLSDVLREFNTMDTTIIQKYMADITSAVKHLHDNGIVHGDIKPSNVLLDDNGVAKLTDFDNAFLKSEDPEPNDASEPLGVFGRLSAQAENRNRGNDGGEQQLGGKVFHRGPKCPGTPYYLAPEVALDMDRLSFPADIWSVGCTALELATGIAPWKDEFNNDMVSLMKCLREQHRIPQVPDELDPDLADFIYQCLHCDPTQRYTALQLALHDFVCGEQTSI